MTNPTLWARIPAPLRQRAQWAITPGTDTDKAPRTTSGAHASSTDPSTWTTFEAACAEAARRGWHIGYVLTADDPFACIDLDVKDDTPPERLEMFKRIVESLDSYTESSRSGKGAHVWVLGKIGAGSKRDGVEVYSQERFIVCTGNAWDDKPIADRQQMLVNMVWQMRGTNDVVEDQPETETDQSIIERATAAANGEKFTALCKGDWKALGYPSQSEADCALLSILAFWSPNNAQVRRLFRLTELGKRDKAKRDDYLNRTLAPVRARQLQEKQRAEALQATVAPTLALADEVIAKARLVNEDEHERTFVPPDLELGEMFEELVYIAQTGSHIAFRNRPWISMSISDMSRFLSHNKTTVKNDKDKDVEVPTFNLWLGSANRNSVHTISFDPDKGPLFGSALDGAEVSALNLWRRRPYLPIDHAEQRASRFIEHVEYLIPVKAEREWFLDWLAHIEQKPGEIPHHHWLMIAPTQGIGRNTLFKILARVFQGYTALDFNLTQCLDSGYNGRLSRKLLIVVNEIQEGGNWSNSQALKSLVTDETRLINPKYGHQRVEKNCARWVLLSNHEDAIPLDDTDRRWCVVANPSQPETEEYYRRLHVLADDELFIASVREYLRRRDISKFKAGRRAGMNEAKETVIAATRCVEEERAKELVRCGEVELCTHEWLFQRIYGVAPDPADRETSRRWNKLRGFVTKAGIVPLKPFTSNRMTYKVWAVLNAQVWQQAHPDAIVKKLGHA